MVHRVYLTYCGKVFHCVEFPKNCCIWSEVEKSVGKTFSDNFYLIQNGKIFNENDVLVSEFLEVSPRCLGGKGGFGSMLRAIGAQIEKTTNREACRDLSGRRLRDINEEQRLKKWVEEQAERERDNEDKKKKKLAKLKQEPKHEFKDPEYDKIRAEMMDKVHSAIEEGLKAADELPSTSGVKRKLEPKQKKNSLLWIDDLGSDIDDSDENNDDDDESDAKKIKIAAT